MVSQVSVHGCLAPLLLDPWQAETLWQKSMAQKKRWLYGGQEAMRTIIIFKKLWLLKMLSDSQCDSKFKI
jgi:hypothetical protein